MSRIHVAIVIAAAPATVWADVRRLATHVDWMADARAIDFTSSSTEGIGTSFRCLTKVGPITLTDYMTVTEWDEGQRIGIVHQGIVTGEGRFTLGPAAGGGTEFSWDERLTFPWWMGGVVGATVGSQVLKRIWKHNLANLARRFE
jgi:hypothetical protein